MRAIHWILVGLFPVLALGCSEKGLMGIELGGSVEAAKSAFRPKSGEGTWKTTGDQEVYEAAGGVPGRVVLYREGGKLAGVGMTFEAEAVRAAGEGHDAYSYQLKQKQKPEGAKGPFEHGQVVIHATADTLYSALDEGDHVEIHRWDRAATDTAAGGCDDVGGIVERLHQGVRTRLGEDGVRMGPERDDAIRRLRLLAAAAELACPDSSGVLATVGAFFDATGRYNGALERFTKALKLDKLWLKRTASDAQGGLGAVHARYKRFTDADERFRLAVQTADTPANKARWARIYADRLHAANRFGDAAKYYESYLENASATDVADTQRVYARLVRSWLESESGCGPATKALEKGMAIEGAPDRVKAEMLAAKAFQTIACDPKSRKAAMKDLEEAVKLDPLMAAEWARLVSYYDREAQDELVIQIMLDQGWLEPTELKNAREYQKLMREQTR